MADLAATLQLPDLTAVAHEGGAAEGDPRPVYTFQSDMNHQRLLVRSYTPSDGGPPRLVANVCAGSDRLLSVWDSRTGAFLRALQGPQIIRGSSNLVTYQRCSDGRPRVAAAYHRGVLYIWDGDDYSLLHAIETDAEGRHLQRLAVYEEPTSASTRLVTG
jgi:WD40 repeat protein